MQYPGGEEAMEPLYFQGEKVKGTITRWWNTKETRWELIIYHSLIVMVCKKGY